MPYPAKQFYAAGCMAKEEASYLAGGTLTPASDGIQLALDGGRAVAIAYQEDFSGEKSYDLAARSPLPMLAPSQAYLNGIELPFHWKGNSAAYSSTVKPALHVWMKAAGLDASFAGSKWSYIPWAGGAITSLVAALYSGAEKFPLTGALAAWRWVKEGGKPVVHTFRTWAVMGDPVDDLGGAEALTIVYPSLTLDPPTSLTVQIGDFLAADVRKAEFDLGWEDPSPRQLGSAAGAFAGWARGISFNPRLKITLEKTALVGTPFHSAAGLGHYQLRKTAQKLAGSKVVVQEGSVSGNRLKTTFLQAQVAAPVTQEQNGSISEIMLELRPYSSSPTANDAVLIEAD